MGKFNSAALFLGVTVVITGLIWSISHVNWGAPDISKDTSRGNSEPTEFTDTTKSVVSPDQGRVPTATTHKGHKTKVHVSQL